MNYTITQIAQAKRNTERVNLYLNGKFWLGISKNDLISFKLIQGKEISELEKAEIEKTALNSKNIEKAIAYIQIHPRSCSEVRDYLVYRKGIIAEEAENVIAYLQEKELLSDEKFTEWYVNYKLSIGTNGPNKIKTELMQKRVDKNIITEALERLYQNDDFKGDQLIKIEEYARKIMPTIKYKSAYEFKSKLVQKLMTKGFKYDEIKQVLVTLSLQTR
jgi:regulatory protein